MFSDCHPGVLQRLRNNVKLNGLMEETPPLVSVEELDWTSVTEDQIKQTDADVIIAAGLLYLTRFSVDVTMKQTNKQENRYLFVLAEAVFLPCN